MSDKTRTNALGIALTYVFASAIVILFGAYYYAMDYIFWSYLFTAVILVLTTAWIIWYAYLSGNIALAVMFWIIGIVMVVLLTYFVLEYHSKNITVVIRPI